MAVELRRMQPEDREAVARLSDELVGPGYYTPEEVTSFLERSSAGDLVLSYVAETDRRLVAFRFALPPGRWEGGCGHALTRSKWPAPREKAGYFQSCFVAPDFAGQGIGRRLAELALADLRRLGARFVVVHSWKESPGDSSRRYLSRLGFEPVAEHPGYWGDIAYLCGGCRKRPCTCTAVEMVLDLEVEGR